MTTAYIGGTFDLFHCGHVQLLQWAKASHDEVVVALNTDEFVGRFKSQRPVQTLVERLEVVAACRFVDRTDVNWGCEDSRDCILRNKATHIVVGEDWKDMVRYRTQLGLTEEWLQEHGVTIVVCDLRRILSTTELKERIK